MDKRNKTALAYLLVGVAAAGRALLAVPENAAIQEVSLTVLALVGYLLLASKTRLPTVFGAAGLIQAGQAAAVFQPGIRQRGADRVRVRVLVADDVDVAYRVVCHSGSPSYTLFPSSSRPCLPLGGRCPEGAEGENLAIARSLLTWPGSLPHPLRREPPPRGGQGECKAVWFN